MLTLQVTVIFIIMIIQVTVSLRPLAAASLTIRSQPSSSSDYSTVIIQVAVIIQQTVIAKSRVELGLVSKSLKAFTCSSLFSRKMNEKDQPQKRSKNCCYGYLTTPKRMNFRKVPFSIPKFILQIFAIINDTSVMNFEKKLQYYMSPVKTIHSSI